MTPPRLSPHREAEIRVVKKYDGDVQELLRELDAVRAEREEAQKDAKWFDEHEKQMGAMLVRHAEARVRELEEWLKQINAQAVDITQRVDRALAAEAQREGSV